MMRALFASLCMLALVGCDPRERSPVAPRTPGTPPAAPGPTSSQTYTISGTVKTSENLAAAGARVVVLGQESSAFATTDGDGHYSISGVRPSPAEGMAPLLSASKTGFFTDLKFADSNYLPISMDTGLDFALAPWVQIPLGEVVRGLSPIGPRVCSHWGYGASECQRFGVTAPATGSLDVTISAPLFNFDVDIVGPAGSFVLYDGRWASPLRLAIPVEAGATYELRVIGGWNPAREFELTVAMR